ncbi:MAG: glycosyltransferase [Candidatus Binatia bacterium]
MGKNSLVKWGRGFVTDRLCRILQVNGSDLSGGAQRVVWTLFQAYRARGYTSRLAVGYKESDDPDVFTVPKGTEQWWSRLYWVLHSRLQSLDGNGRLSRLARELAHPGALLEKYRGIENFCFPGTWRLLGMFPRPPDIVHCHNLHEEYFDLRALPWVSHHVPTVLTLHDAWLLSGHCAHSLDCERWKIGCGKCPDLTLYPPVRRDATAHNWKRKRDIMAQSRLYVATPSQWLMNKVRQSILGRAVAESRVIPNGVDLKVFRQADKRAARAALRIAPHAKVLLFAANRIQRHVWKDFDTVRAAVMELSRRLQVEQVLFIGLGESGLAEPWGDIEVCFVPYQKDPKVIAGYYQAADVYVHAARAEVWGLAITEALACGTPVVATAVGGIPEQVKSLGHRVKATGVPTCGLEEATGLLVAQGDAEGMAAGLEQLVTDEPLRQHLASNAARDACKRFSLERQVEEYLGWYREILNEPGRQCPSSSVVP